MIVVKLGGSLSKADTLLNCLNKLEQNHTDSAVVIVPGGGALPIKSEWLNNAGNLTIPPRTEWRF